MSAQKQLKKGNSIAVCLLFFLQLCHKHFGIKDFLAIRELWCFCPLLLLRQVRNIFKFAFRLRNNESAFLLSQKSFIVWRRVGRKLTENSHPGAKMR